MRLRRDGWQACPNTAPLCKGTCGDPLRALVPLCWSLGTLGEFVPPPRVTKWCGRNRPVSHSGHFRVFVRVTRPMPSMFRGPLSGASAHCNGIGRITQRSNFADIASRGEVPNPSQVARAPASQSSPSL